MLKEYIRKQVIKFIEGEINLWIESMNNKKEAYEAVGVRFSGSEDERYYNHVISAYEFLLMHARTHNF